MREPNFFIVGAAKAGTTSLYHYLDQHPDIYMSPLKEPCYFSAEVRPEGFESERRADVERLVEETRAYLSNPIIAKRSDGIVCDWPTYLRLFAGATCERAVGEASVSYLWSRTAAEEIARRLPRAKILIVLRSPAERAFSQYMHAISDGVLTQSFHDFVRSALRHNGEGFGIYRPFLEMGFYADQVRRYQEHFPRNQIRVWLYEETKERPREFMREVLEFLEVDSTFVPDTSKHYNRPCISRGVKSKQMLRRLGVWQMLRRVAPAPVKAKLHKAIYRPAGSLTMEPQDRALMLDFYRNDIQRLQALIQRDLSDWLV
jgi:hypothetical protein